MLVTGIFHLPYDCGHPLSSFFAAAMASGLPDYRIHDIHGCIIPPTRPGLRGHPYKVLQVNNRRQRGESQFSGRFVKHWNKLPASIDTAPSFNVLKKRLDKVWTEIVPHLPY